MSTPYIGQIQIFAFNFPPKFYALCQGQLMPINQNQALFSILGTTYGGNGQTTFALPDLRGRIPFQFDRDHLEGAVGGEENHTLVKSEMAAHNHFLMTDSSTTSGTTNTPTATEVLGVATGVQQPSGSFSVAIYGPSPAIGVLDQNAIGPSGGSQAHANLMPYLTINYSIALSGIFPSQN